ncbi:MAG: response regulator transcription factor, partial [Solirubrobacterales bacterium]
GRVLVVARRLPGAAAPAPPAALTAREREVLGWLVDGFTNREIAAEIHLSQHAVKKHASAIFRKLGVRNRTEAARVARGLLVAR